MKIVAPPKLLRERFAANAGHYPRPTPCPRGLAFCTSKPERVSLAARRAFSRLIEPPVRHLGPITVTLQELAGIIRTALATGPISYEILTRDMDRLNRAVAFAAALSLAQEGSLTSPRPNPRAP